MLERFKGKIGQARLLEALMNQCMVQHNQAIAKCLLKKVKLRDYASGEILMDERAADCDLFFIIHGRVSILLKGREVGLYRETGEHVGEMALVDNAPRSATVKAVENTVVACICEPDFVRIANKFPSLWRGIAARLARRLRERSKFIRQPNVLPNIFIGSSGEALKVAKAIETQLKHSSIVVKLWKTPEIFRASETTIESLIKQVDASDFGILVLGPDDEVISRNKKHRGPRDNVLFELGLFMGALGRKRTIIVSPDWIKIKWPSDLFGVTPLLYGSPRKRDFMQSIFNACTQIRKIISELKSK
jgi:predicted nucleotide-binding protein